MERGATRGTPGDVSPPICRTSAPLDTETVMTLALLLGPAELFCGPLVAFVPRRVALVPQLGSPPLPPSFPPAPRAEGEDRSGAFLLSSSSSSSSPLRLPVVLFPLDGGLDTERSALVFLPLFPACARVLLFPSRFFSPPFPRCTSRSLPLSLFSSVSLSLPLQLVPFAPALLLRALLSHPSRPGRVLVHFAR